MGKSDNDSERRERGQKLIRQLYGEVGVQTLRSLNETMPDLARFIEEFAFGDIFSRPGLELKTRELATVAALAAMGNAPAQLRAHIHGALNAGCTQQEILEIILQMLLYAGFPAAINGVQAAKEVFGARRAKSV
jgi:4-carboxymuconolactone decarboxylase